MSKSRFSKVPLDQHGLRRLLKMSLILSAIAVGLIFVIVGVMRGIGNIDGVELRRILIAAPIAFGSLNMAMYLVGRSDVRARERLVGDRVGKSANQDTATNKS